MRYIAIVETHDRDFFDQPLFKLLIIEQDELDETVNAITRAIVTNFGRLERNDGTDASYYVLDNESISKRFKVYPLFVTDKAYQNWLGHQRISTLLGERPAQITSVFHGIIFDPIVNQSSVDSFLNVNNACYEREVKKTLIRTKEKALLIAQGINSNNTDSNNPSPFTKLTDPSLGGKIAIFATQAEYSPSKEELQRVEVTATEVIDEYVKRKQPAAILPVKKPADKKHEVQKPETQKPVTLSSASSSIFFPTPPTTPAPAIPALTLEAKRLDSSQDTRQDNNNKSRKQNCIVM